MKAPKTGDAINVPKTRVVAQVRQKPTILFHSFLYHPIK
jgi:hypothetical protein